MPKPKPDYPIVALLSCINTLGYGTLAHIFLTKMMSSRDLEVVGFPITLSSDPFTKMVILNLGTAIAAGSSIVVAAGLAWAGVHYNEYCQRRLNQMPEKKRKRRRHRTLKNMSRDFSSYVKSKANPEDKKPDVKPDNTSDNSPEPWN